MRGSSGSLSTQIGGLPQSAPAGGVSSFGYSGTIVHAVLTRAESSTMFSDEPDPALLVYKRQAFPWADVPHPFLQRRLLSTDVLDATFRSAAMGTLQAVVANHVVRSRIVFPGAGHLELGRAAHKA